MSEEKAEGIKVVDKRRFTDEGEQKAGAVEQEPAFVSDSVDKVSESGSAAQVSASKEAGGDQAGVEALDFSSFIVSLATQSLMMLGEIPDPGTGERSLNLGAAQQTIDIVAMLEEKTKGNLSDNENQLMTEVLSSLRIAYVQKKKEVKGS